MKLNGKVDRFLSKFSKTTYDWVFENPIDQKQKYVRGMLLAFSPLLLGILLLFLLVLRDVFF